MLILRALSGVAIFATGVFIGVFALGNDASDAPGGATQTPPSSSTVPHRPGPTTTDELLYDEFATARGSRSAPDDGTDLSSVNASLAALSRRVSALEAQLTELASEEHMEEEQVFGTPVETGLSQAALIEAGVEPMLADDIVRRQSRLDMQELELRDQAGREGWSRSERFFDELRLLRGDADSLREEIGEDAYDRFLYLTGQPNRIVITSVIGDSPAQVSGIRSGDLFLEYDGSRIFGANDLRDATRSGQKGESVGATVLREGQVVHVMVPRGPLGVRMDTDRMDPDLP